MEGLRDLSMDSHEEWSILDSVEIKPVHTRCEIESADEGPFICE